MTIRLLLIAFGALSLLMSVQCPQTNPQEHCDGSVFLVKPLIASATDATDPVATIGTYINGSNLYTSGTLNLTLKGNESLLFSAKGADPESGIRTVEIWYKVRSWKNNVEMPSQYPANPVKENKDASNPNAGDSACESRNVAITLNMPDLILNYDRVVVDIWTRTENCVGKEAIARAILKWN